MFYLLSCLFHHEVNRLALSSSSLSSSLFLSFDSSSSARLASSSYLTQFAEG
ncbi:hypothetical protein CSUI_007944, partial [Cystoisospora suis]